MPDRMSDYFDVSTRVCWVPRHDRDRWWGVLRLDGQWLPKGYSVSNDGRSHRVGGDAGLRTDKILGGIVVFGLLGGLMYELLRRVGF